MPPGKEERSYGLSTEETLKVFKRGDWVAVCARGSVSEQQLCRRTKAGRPGQGQQTQAAECSQGQLGWGGGGDRTVRATL